MKIASLYLIMLTLGGYVLACSMPKVMDQAKPFATGDYQYTGYDKEGSKIVEGRLSITSVEPNRNQHEESYEIKGHWQLNQIGNPEKIGPQVGSGNLFGSIDKGEIYINLNPNMNDNNVILQGKIEGRRCHGTWRYSGFAGAINQGTFEAARK
ncbi:MAG: hypothetical protein V7641_365 [Blastocatellia bacterium]